MKRPMGCSQPLVQLKNDCTSGFRFHLILLSSLFIKRNYLAGLLLIQLSERTLWMRR